MKENNRISSDLAERVDWAGGAQARVHRYGRVISLAKRTSIFCGKNFPNAFPLLFVLGHYKSGTTWMCQILSDYLRIPFPQYSIMPLGCKAVLHSYEVPSSKYRSGVYMIRDGRDSAVSAYFHIRGQMLAGNPAKYNKKMFAGLDLEAEPIENMATFVQRLLDYPSGGWTKLPNWGDHVKAYFELEEKNLKLAKYEDLLDDGPGTLSGIVEQLTGEEADMERINETINRFSFKRQTGRSQGDENRKSYLRKGQAGDWRNHFSREAAEIFNQRYGDVLVKAGYETDGSWVNEVSQ